MHIVTTDSGQGGRCQHRGRTGDEHLKVFPNLLKHHDMQMYGGVGVELHDLTSARLGSA